MNEDKEHGSRVQATCTGMLIDRINTDLDEDEKRKAHLVRECKELHAR